MFNKKTVLGSIAGILIGSAAALLLAPKSGVELVKGLFKKKPAKHQKTPVAPSNKKKAAKPKKKARAPKSST